MSLSPADAKKREVTVPVEIGVGPAANIISVEMQEHQTFFYGARINLEAVIDKALIKKYKKRIPKEYRKMAMQLDEVRFRPAPLSYIPKTLYLSPGDNAMYGAMWDLFGVGTRLGPLKASADVQFAYAHLSYQAMDKAESAQSMHLLRPAIGFTAHIPLMLTDSVGFDVGWRSTWIPPTGAGGLTHVLHRGSRWVDLAHRPSLRCVHLCDAVHDAFMSAERTTHETAMGGLQGVR